MLVFSFLFVCFFVSFERFNQETLMEKKRQRIIQSLLHSVIRRAAWENHQDAGGGEGWRAVAKYPAECDVEQHLWWCEIAADSNWNDANLIWFSRKSDVRLFLPLFSDICLGFCLHVQSYSSLVCCFCCCDSLSSRPAIPWYLCSLSVTFPPYLPYNCVSGALVLS